MKKTLLVIALTSFGYVNAQNNWTKIGPPPPAIQIIDELIGVSGTTHASADVDNDGDADIIISGQDAQGTLLCTLYLNNGLGAFQIEPSTPFMGVYDGAISFIDVEDDGDQDVIIAGQNSSSWSASLYINDGSGVFTLASSPFEGVGYAAVSVADVDSDTDMDVLICGQANSGVKANLYRNDGIGNFTLDIPASTTFTGVYLGTSEFGDVDSDGDADLVLMGYGDNGSFSGMYLNNGLGVFTLTASNFPQLNSSDVAFSDVDDDTDMDIFLSGNDYMTGPFTHLYLNDGSGVFTLDMASTFNQTGSARLDVADANNDGFDDLVICGSVNGFGSMTNLYLNDGSGVFSVVAGTPFTGVNNGWVSFEDIDADSNLDLIVTGTGIAKLYRNIGNAVYESISTSPFIGLSYGAVELADIDNDGDLDAFMNGQGTQGFESKLYLNNGNGGYALDTVNSFIGAANAAADFADIDNDGDVDLMISGYNNGQFVKLYVNDGSGSFNEVQNTTFPPVSSGAIQFNDVDNDGDQDVFISGFTIFVGNVGQLWLNDGTGQFTLSSNTFEGANNGNIAFADVDGDTDDDLLVTGYGDLGRVAHLYTNNGSGIFTLVSSPFPGVQQGSIAFADVDGDEDLDLAIAGEVGSASYTSQLYTNDGTGAFTLVSGTPMEPTIASGLAFMDVDNDLDVDLVTIGNSSVSGTIAKMYANDGMGMFTLITGTPFIPASYGMLAYGDVDGDIDLDLIICGSDNLGGLQSNVWRNDNCQQANVFDEQFSCGPYTWIDGNTYFQSTNSPTILLPMASSAGCDSVAVLHLTIGDAIAVPTVASLPDITEDCEVTTLAAPTATWNCTGIVTATTTTTFPISGEGTSEIVWLYTAPNGATFTQTQQVIIHDVTAPTPDVSTLPVYTSSCPIINLPVIPTATDNCVGLIIGTTNDLPVTTPGTTTITWSFTDANGNTSTQTQDVTYSPLSNQIVFDGTTFSAVEPNQTYQWYDCNTETELVGETNQQFTPTGNGTYQVSIGNQECTVYSECFVLSNLSLADAATNVLSIFPNPNAGTFSIETTHMLSIEITDAEGKLIQSEKVEAGKKTIELKTRESGIYFVNTTDQSGRTQYHKITVIQ